MKWMGAGDEETEKYYHTSEKTDLGQMEVKDEKFL